MAERALEPTSIAGSGGTPSLTEYAARSPIERIGDPLRASLELDTRGKQTRMSASRPPTPYLNPGNRHRVYGQPPTVNPQGGTASDSEPRRRSMSYIPPDTPG